MGDSGLLLNKMLEAIKIKRNNIYITNVVNYRPPNNRKPEPSEINRYSNFLRQHISIIDPKILILMGSTAMESLFGSKIKITKERGVWKELIIHNKDKFTGEFNKYCIENKVDTSWGDISLVKATLNLFKEAFNNKDNRYFILLSDKCIPLYSESQIYDKVITTNDNIILRYKLHRERYDSLPVSYTHLRAHETR